MPRAKLHQSGQPGPLRVCIVGGGSAGWMLAVYLSQRLGDLASGSNVNLTLVESSEVPPTGVGEATIQTMRSYLAECGIVEADFLSKCGATLKHGIEFANWNNSGRNFFHPFETPPPIHREPLALHYLASVASGRSVERYDHWTGIQSRLARKGVSPRRNGDPEYEATLPYGYHLDANAFAHFLKGIAVSRGVQHKIAHVESIEVESGRIRSLGLRGGNKVDADFWIDCTGFKAHLITALGGKFLNFADRLPVDTALTCQLEGPIRAPRPYTTATARTAGWTFDIDLQKRGGRGYVFSRAHLDVDRAANEFAAAYPGEVKPQNFRHFDLRVGRMDRCWIGNCVAVGLSAGFLEPMESTGLYFVEFASRLLLEVFDSIDLDARENHAQLFNQAFASLFDETADFIEMHYCLSDRRDSDFWCDVAGGMASKTLAERLEVWRYRLPTSYDFDSRAFFGPESWTAILLGHSHRPIAQRRIHRIDVRESLKLVRELDLLSAQVGAQHPLHSAYLRDFNLSVISSRTQRRRPD